MKLFELPIYRCKRSQVNQERFWRCFEYNEAIGWIALEPRTLGVRAEYWFVRQRPTSPLVRKEFEYKGKLFQIRIKGLKSMEIYNRLHAALSEHQECSFLSKFHFDMEAFEAVGPHIDWNRAVAEALDPQSQQLKETPDRGRIDVQQDPDCQPR